MVKDKPIKPKYLRAKIKVYPDSYMNQQIRIVSKDGVTRVYADDVEIRGIGCIKMEQQSGTMPRVTLTIFARELAIDYDGPIGVTGLGDVEIRHIQKETPYIKLKGTRNLARGFFKKRTPDT